MSPTLHVQTDMLVCGQTAGSEQVQQLPIQYGSVPGHIASLPGSC